MNLDSLRTAADLSATKPHGTRLKYMGGCKCMLCRAANSRYETERAVARKNGDWNGIVDARAARRHILKLSKAGVGYKSVADAASVAHSVVAEIRAGRKLRIRQRTERSILAVTKTAYARGALIDADPNRGRRAFTMYPTASRGVIRQKRQLCLAHAPKNALTALRPRRAATLQTRWQRSMTSSGVMGTIRPRPGGFNRSMRRQPRRASRT